MEVPASPQSAGAHPATGGISAESPVRRRSQVCYSLLQAKQEALDRGAAFPYADAALCDRCRAVFATLDIGRKACQSLRSGVVPSGLLERVQSVLSQP